MVVGAGRAAGRLALYRLQRIEMPADVADPHGGTIAVAVISLLRTGIEPILKHGAIAHPRIPLAEQGIGFGIGGSGEDGIFGRHRKHGVIGIGAPGPEQVHSAPVKALGLAEFKTGPRDVP